MEKLKNHKPGLLWVYNQPRICALRKGNYQKHKIMLIRLKAKTDKSSHTV